MLAPRAIRSRIDPSLLLSKRQVDILNRLQAGVLPKQIAVELGLSYYTIVEHIARAMGRFSAHSRIQLINAAIGHGFIKPPTPTLAPSEDDARPPRKHRHHRFHRSK